MSQTVELFWDPASSYSYLASTQIDAVLAGSGAVLHWRPFLLGAAFKASGNQPPVAVPAKGAHLFVDLQRWAQLYGVGICTPKSFPLNSLLPTRAATVVARTADGPRFAKALLAAHWRDGRDISDANELGAICTTMGLDAEAILEQAQGQDIKDELRATTEDAIARGAFGAPTLFVGESMFWGNDRLDMVRALLDGRISR